MALPPANAPPTFYGRAAAIVPVDDRIAPPSRRQNPLDGDRSLS
jgi:hypothetical protein